MKKNLLLNIFLALCLGLILNYLFLGQMNWKNDTLCQEISSVQIADGCRALEYGSPLKWLTSTAELTESGGVVSVVKFDKTNLILNVIFYSGISYLVLAIFQHITKAKTVNQKKRKA